MTLAYLDFDYNEDAEGHGCWDAMACVAVERLPALWRELAAVLAWAEALPGLQRGTWEEGGDWDAVVQAQTQAGHPLSVVYEPHIPAWRLAQPPTESRVVVVLTVVGSAAFGAAFAERFRLDR